MLTVFQPPPVFGTPSASPFCTKLQTWLRIAGIPYTVERGSPTAAPKGKMPYVRLADGTLMGDSQLIIERLAREHGDPVDGWLTGEQRAQAHTVRRMLEEGTYFVMVAARWREEDGWAAYRPYFAGLMPPVIGPVILPLVRRSVLRALHAQGTGRHTREEVDALGVADVAALAAILGDRPYLMGERPCSVDANVLAFVWGTTAFPVPSAVKSAVLSHPNLVAHCERMRARYFPPTELAPG